MNTKIEIENKKVYIVMSDYDFFEPRIISNYWEVEIDYTLLNNNQYLELFNGVYITKIQDHIIPLYFKNEYPDFTRFYSIKPPRKTGYKWYNGNWIKK